MDLRYKMDQRMLPADMAGGWGRQYPVLRVGRTRSGVSEWGTGQSKTKRQWSKPWRHIFVTSIDWDLRTNGDGCLITASTLPPNQQQKLICPILPEEVKAVVWGLNSEGAPRPDRIPVFFYKEWRDVVGLEVMAVLEDFRGGRCQMESLNRVYLVLLPKTSGAEQTGNFRSISLSNSIT